MDSGKGLARRFSSVADIFATRSRISMGALRRSPRPPRISKVATAPHLIRATAPLVKNVQWNPIESEFGRIMNPRSPFCFQPLDGRLHHG